MDAEALYRQHIPQINQIARSVCRRNGVNDHDAEDFTSDVHLKVCENDYAVVRKWQGKSTFVTYLTMVINHSYIDHLRQQRGKWTPSSAAKRMGPVAVMIEQLISRDSRSFDETCTIIEQRFRVGRAEVKKTFDKLPRRLPPRPKSADELPEDIQSPDEADTRVTGDERDHELSIAAQAIRELVAQLPDEDRVIVRMRYLEGVSVADIARALRLDQKRLYPRIEALLASLRKGLESRGISADVLLNVDSG